MNSDRATSKRPPRVVAFVWISCAVAVVLLSRPVYLDAVNSQLVTAVRRGSVADVERLLKLGADPNGRRANPSAPVLSLPPICEAAKNGYNDVARVLLAHGARPETPGGRYAPALILAARTGNTELVRLLLDHGADVRVADPEMETPLISGAAYPDVVRLLVERGAPIDAADRMQHTALLRAVSALNTEGVRLLLSHGAKANVPVGRGVTPLKWAVLISPIVNSLPPQGPQLPLTPQGAPPESSEERRRRSEKALEILRLLLDAGADPNFRTNDRVTPLMLAAIHPPEFTETLLSHGADPNSRDGHSATALSFALRCHADEAVKLLRQHGAAE